MNTFTPPGWVPTVEPGSKILVVGASGGIGRATVSMLESSHGCIIGAHRASPRPETEQAHAPQVIPLEKKLTDDAACVALVDEFAGKAGGLNGLVVLCGGIARTAHWADLTEQEWSADISLNLSIPFFLARAAMRHMRTEGQGRIVLNGTESAIHGGSPGAFPYAVAKRGTECLVQGLAREGAQHRILVNGIRLGFIQSGFHERWQGKRAEDLSGRVSLIPLKRGGTPEEAAALIIYLLSGWGSFITGQMLALTGGDWL